MAIVTMIVKLLLATITFTVIVNCFPTQTVDRDLIIENEEFLDSNEKFHLKWRTNLRTKKITFTITAETVGYVGLGLSQNGGMNGADIVIAGVHPHGYAYISDRFGVLNAVPEIDRKQDWELLNASENGTHTIVTVSRPLDTCDEQDKKVENGTNKLIWAVGEADDIVYHGRWKGAASVHLLDFPPPKITEDRVETWRLTTELEMPAKETTYWCTVKKFPPLKKKHHMIGFEPYMPSAAALTHSHHLIVRECVHPEGKDLSPILDPLVAKRGGVCYRSSNTVIASDGSQYCKAYIFVWAIGGKKTTFPSNVGFPIGDGKTSHYYMLEIHLNNPENLVGVKMETGINIFYTPSLRSQDASTLIVGHEVSIAQTIPPKIDKFVTVGHCSSRCTAATLPADGIKVFNVLLHSHNAGINVKLRHFRNGTELPWISFDDYYNFDFQQSRQLQHEVTILRGDQLAFECTYDTSERNGVTVGGYSSQDEMCQAVLMYYPRIDLEMCSSLYPLNAVLDIFGIGELKSEANVGNPIILSPAELHGLRYTDVLNELEWTQDNSKSFEEALRYSYHRAVCSSRPSYGSRKNQRNLGLPPKWYIYNVTYALAAEPYAPPLQSCVK